MRLNNTKNNINNNTKNNSSKQESKPWYKSKTIWLNILLTLTAIIDLLIGFDFVSTKAILLIGGILNAVIRIWFTHVSIKK